ncbi:39S ribosomal protein L2, mitochondrial isoform X3 [Tupaia chinensis]|uniref:39S ribosomal protein L2, mitochondrial isoform X3 n=1 Tax=Tupaia chinensis TaxID=246437 RepID=UPI000703D048|nr:39S ribosomal protein L2, mitochondrial isoform X3 [Tupaia chinensis]
MALWALTRALGSLSLAPPAAAVPAQNLLPAAQVMSNALFQLPSALTLLPCRPILTSVALSAKFVSWKSRTKYTIIPVKMRKSGGRDHTGRIRVHGIGGGHKQRYRMIDFLRFRPEQETKPGPFEEKVVRVRYDPCRSADIALVAGGSRKRWIIATENMQAGDTILNSDHIGRMAVAAREGDAHPLGALPVGTLINNVESEPGRGAQYIRAAASSSSVDGGKAASPFPRDMWCAAAEGEWDSHHPAALQEADAGAGNVHGNGRPSVQR